MMVHKSESQNELQRQESFRSQRKLRFLQIALFITCIIAISLLIALIVVATSTKEVAVAKEIDTTNAPGYSEVVKTAAYVLSSMNSSADPCSDFYEFACGTWMKSNVIPDDKSSQNVFGVLRDDLLVKVRRLLEESPADSEKASTSIGSARKLYLSCMNETNIELQDSKPLDTYLLKKIGDWPMISGQWSDSNFDLVDMAAKLGLIGSKAFWNFWVSTDDKNSSVNIIQFDQPEVGLPSREYYLKPDFAKYVAAYKDFMVNVAREYNSSLSIEQLRQEVNDAVALETAVANLTTPRELRRNHEELYNRMTIQEMHNITNKVNWTKFLQLIFQAVNVTLTTDEPVVVYNPEYLQRVAELLEQTPKRTIANMMMLRVVLGRVKYLSKRFRAKEFEYSKALYGTEVDRARWKTCASVANNNLGNAVGRMFVSRHFDEESKSRALDMIKDIRKSFDELLFTNTWMDDATRQAAKVKADAIADKIGYPDSILNNTALDEEYKNLRPFVDDYFANMVTLSVYFSEENLRQLRKPVDRDRWSSAPAVVNAFYSTVKNQIVFPAGILQPPFYGKFNPKALNYGAIGMVIGHEITHGFDDQGKQYDKDGNLIQWWSNSSDQAFKTKADCIVQQYSSYNATQVGMRLNGVQTQGENIADNGGIKQAFKAYRSWVARNGEEPKLPGVNLTPDQLFFVGFAQVWCGIDKDNALVNSITTGSHSPGKFRVIGTVSNSEDFSRAYNCPSGAAMNPQQKCSVW